MAVSVSVKSMRCAAEAAKGDAAILDEPSVRAARWS
jgi:hypothetical protein